jgi:hypothetical protein
VQDETLYDRIRPSGNRTHAGRAPGSRRA